MPSAQSEGVATLTLAGFLSGKTDEGNEGLFSPLSPENIELIQAQGFPVRTASPGVGVTSRAASSIGAPVVVSSTDSTAPATPSPTSSPTPSTPPPAEEEEEGEPTTVAQPTLPPPSAQP